MECPGLTSPKNQLPFKRSQWFAVGNVPEISLTLPPQNWKTTKPFTGTLSLTDNCHWNDKVHTVYQWNIKFKSNNKRVLSIFNFRSPNIEGITFSSGNFFLSVYSSPQLSGSNILLWGEKQRVRKPEGQQWIKYAFVCHSLYLKFYLTSLTPESSRSRKTTSEGKNI